MVPDTAASHPPLSVRQRWALSPKARLTDVGADDDGHRGGYLSTSRKSVIGDKMLSVAADVARRQTECD